MKLRNIRIQMWDDNGRTIFKAQEDNATEAGKKIKEWLKKFA